MKIEDIKMDYDVTKYEQQVTKDVKITKEIKLNHWVTLKVGDVICFEQSFAGMKFPTSTASYEMYINNKSGGGGTQNCLINLLDVHYNDTALEGFTKFYSQIEGGAL